jgi:hypothetical protein
MLAPNSLGSVRGRCGLHGNSRRASDRLSLVVLACLAEVESDVQLVCAEG